MSFICAATGKLVQNQRRILVPAQTRKVVYEGYFQMKNRDGSTNMVFDSATEGWEAVKEIAVSENAYPIFIEGFKPEQVETKTVQFIKPRKQQKRYAKHNDDEDDKPSE